MGWTYHQALKVDIEGPLGGPLPYVEHPNIAWETAERQGPTEALSRLSSRSRVIRGIMSVGYQFRCQGDAYEGLQISATDLGI